VTLKIISRHTLRHLKRYFVRVLRIEWAKKVNLPPFNS